MDEEKKEQGKKCFIITPIGNDGTETFRKAKGVIESVIKPILQKNGFDDIKPAYEIVDSGMIGNQIVSRIVEDDLVVTNLTGNNPNVMYELAIRHASAKPIIHICENGTVLPFDIKDNRTIFYTDDMLGVQELQSKFESFVEKINYSEDYMDNPIYSAIKIGTIFKEMHDEGQQNVVELFQEILDKISNISGKSNVVLSGKSRQEKDIYANVAIKCEDSKMVEEFKDMLVNISGIKKIDYTKTNRNDIWEFKVEMNYPGWTEEMMSRFIHQIANDLGIQIIVCDIW